MSRELKIQEFDDKQVRIVWDDEEQKYYFSVTDVVGVLTEQSDARGATVYWAVLKKRLKQEGANELITNCKQLKLPATDGKNRATDVADIEQLLRIIQSIPSKKAYPNKEQQHGLFTYYLLKKLQESAGDIALKDLGDYITKQVSQQSLLLNDKKQTPCVTPSASVGTEWQNWKLR